SIPIEEAGHRIADLRSGLILSQIELQNPQGMIRYRFETLSKAAESYWDSLVRARAFNEQHRSLRRQLAKEIAKQSEIAHAIESDRSRFRDPERFRRAGELLLANINSAQVDNNIATVVDYFAEDQPKTQIEVPERTTLQEAASDYFARYQ